MTLTRHNKLSTVGNTVENNKNQYYTIKRSLESLG